MNLPQPILIEEEVEWNPKYPERHPEIDCPHILKFFGKCTGKCKKVYSENSPPEDLQELIEILQGYQRSHKLVEMKL